MTETSTHNDGTVDTGTAVELADITFRQADYWTSKGIAVPTFPASGPGSRRRWSPADIVGLRDTGRVSSVFNGGEATMRSVLTEVNRMARSNPDAPEIRVDLGNGVSLVIKR